MKFKKEVDLEKEEVIEVHGVGNGMVQVDGMRHPFQTKIPLEKGRHTILIFICNPTGLPSVYVAGETVVSDENWLASYYGKEWTKVGYSDSCVSLKECPEQFPFAYEEVRPVQTKEVNGGILYDFGKERFAKVCFRNQEMPLL